MANLSSNTNLTIPRGAVVKFGLGGIGQAIDESGTYKLGNQEVILGPYPVAKTITVLVQSTLSYVIDNDGVIDTFVPLDPITPSLTSPAAQAAVRGAVNPLRNRAITLGDSRAGQNFFDTRGSDQAWGMTNRGWWAWLQSLSGNYWQLVQAAGVTADTIAQAAARFDSTTPGELFGGAEVAGAQFGVSPFSPDWIFIELAANSIANSLTLDQMISDANDLISKCEGTGARIVWLTEGAVGGSTAGYGKAYFNRARRWNAWLKQRQHTASHLLVVDVFPETVNPSSATGLSKPNYLYDDIVHAGGYGARRRAELIWAAVQARWGVQRVTWLPISAYETYDAATAPDIANRYPDPLCLAAPTAATGTGNSGNVPTGFVPANCSNATCVYSIVDHPSGYGKCVQMDVTFTAAGGFANLNTQRIESLFSGGETARLGMEVFAYGLNGGTVEALGATHNLLCVKHTLLTVDAAAVTRYTQHFRDLANTDGYQVGNIVNSERIGWLQQLSAGAPSRVQGQIFVVGAGAGSVRVLIGRVAIFANGGPNG